MGTEREKRTGSNFAASAKLRACPLFALPLLLAACAADAAVVKGIVLDNLTGRPLARTRVVLESIERDGVAAKSTTTASSGQFEFTLPGGGWYLVSAERPGFATVRHGQKFWNAPGTPLRVEQDSGQFLTLRMHRLGVITGTVLDENEVGLPQVEVFAYRIAQPPRLIGRTRSDEFGAYRLGMLEPGRYFVRTGPKRLVEEFNLVPTFHREALRPDEALPVEVRMEEQTSEVNIKPAPGRLVNLGVQVHGERAGSVPLLLASEFSRLRGVTNAQGVYAFHALAPGRYELFAGAEAVTAHTSSISRTDPDTQAAYNMLYLASDNQSHRILLNSVAVYTVDVQDQSGSRVFSDKLALWIRRKDLAGVGEPQRLPGSVVRLPSGRWEVRVETPPEFYPVSVSIAGAATGVAANQVRADAWTEINPTDYRIGMLRVVVSRRPASIHGTVTASMSDSAVGAPVYLEAWDDRENRRLGELRQTLTNAQGGFRFRGLAPGVYRIISSFDCNAPDAELMQALNPKLLKVGEGEDAASDLTLYVSQ